MARFFEQKLNFSLFYQNLIGKRFPNNSKRKSFRSVETIIKCSMRLIFDHLLAVNPCGLWTTGEKVGFSKAHSEVLKQPNLKFSFRDLRPNSLLKFNPLDDSVPLWAKRVNKPIQFNSNPIYI
jgi:hypothetical protein